MKYFFFSFLIIITCCRNNESRLIKEAKNLSGKMIVLPDKYENLSIHDSLNVKNEIKKELKIVTYIDSMSCSECALSILTVWETMLHEFEKNVGFIAVVYPVNIDSLVVSLKKLNIQLPLLYDKDNIFIKKNKLNVLARNRTFLLNDKNRITVIGEPVGRKKLWDVYKNAIAKLDNESSIVIQN